MGGQAPPFLMWSDTLEHMYYQALLVRPVEPLSTKAPMGPARGVY